MYERLLQFIWANLYFRQKYLYTSARQPLVILNPGRVNNGDGPDFRQAAIQLDDLVFHGDVELHIDPGGWYEHGHHEDARYDKVILHVVLNDSDFTDARRTDHTIVPTLVLKPYVNENVATLFRKSREKTTLSCAGLVKDIGHETISKQWQRANARYFNYKIQELQNIYDAALPPSEAWRHLLTESLFDGLGIANNRPSMRRLFRLLLQSVTNPNMYSFKEVLELGLSMAGLDTTNNPGYLTHHDWSFSNSRPANQPGVRIPQAIAVWQILWQIPLTSILKEPVASSWTILNGITDMTNPIGDERKNILFTTVYLPALHILGSLFHDTRLQNRVFSAWKTAKINVPSSILGVFRRSGLTDKIIKDNPATVYQYKHLCKASRCSECEIMKMILVP